MAHLGEYIEQIHREQKSAIIEELEKIKEEVNNGYPTSVEDIIWIIDTHISELKEGAS